jgi:hypothetical protein
VHRCCAIWHQSCGVGHQNNSVTPKLLHRAITKEPKIISTLQEKDWPTWWKSSTKMRTKGILGNLVNVKGKTESTRGNLFTLISNYG